MVFFLVKYIEDGIYQVVPKVFRRGSKVCAKYLDGCIYPSEIIAKNHSHNVLDQILRNLQLDLPKVIVGDKFFRCSEEKDSLQDEITLVENIQTIPDDIKVVENEIQSIKPEALSLEGCLPLVTDSFQDEITLLENIQTISDDIKIVEHEIQSIKTEALSLEDLPLVTVVRDIVINQDESPVVPNQGQSSHTQILSTQDSVPLVPDSKQYQILAVQNIMTIQDETQGVHNDQSIQASALSVQNSLSLLPGKTSATVTHKKHSCFYCQKLLNKIYRHYITIHKKEEDVREINTLPSNSGRRKLLLDNLRKKGDYLYNTSIKRTDQPDIVCKETKKEHQRLSDLNVACPRCMGYYSKLSFRQHEKKCMGEEHEKHRRNLEVEANKKQCMRESHGKHRSNLQVEAHTKQCMRESHGKHRSNLEVKATCNNWTAFFVNTPPYC
ncbi:hypothetical protein WA026_011036 [Henosepilachna vigintioctopunctata]|uniref:Uncharacterized protein n=1 Tax=Henosepilachna vigintioctopunctata TaxID=420089 RepID=A0AAW1U069_9CUCU